MRKIISMLFIPLFIFAMAEPAGAPPEVKNIKILVLDRAGKKHELKSPLCEGLSYLKVKHGGIEYSVSLTSLEEIEVLSVSGDVAKIKLKYKNGKEEIFDISANTLCTGTSDFGNASFYLKDVQKILFRRGEK
ncbi:hypothetical protein [Aquifex aeolicus]|uniref:Uncharacterized protein aq_796 n=1 Tax=Aquifex aeolicus (strain VF5) TaxID=224324 RepID=Y796_AQUAE|nr:hypothetical protein [Aquifex aeolicus]O66984.1 RecName: Full=Uncharacterized protein aq_796; Flags: Precursor [Aquifex aeolicus VF5]AAC06953.1 putative protein [Aquifex aeolicus VF5]